MATENVVSSDSDEQYIMDVPEYHKKFLKSKLINSLYDTDNYSLQILHNRGQPAQLIVRLGSKQGKLIYSSHAYL